MSLAAVVQSASPTIIDYVLPTASLLTVALLGYIARVIRKPFRRLREEHDWLMRTTKQNTEQIAANTQAIKAMLDRAERRERRRPGVP